MLDFFRNILSAYSVHSSSYHYSYSKPIPSSPFSSFTSVIDVDFYVYVLAQLVPFLVLLGLPAFALLARTHWATLVKFVQMGFESLFGGLFGGSGSSSSGNANGRRETERSEEKRKRRKEKRDEAARARSLSQNSASDRDSELEEDDADLYYPGLVNISGTYCFLNSVLQATASLAYLQPFLDSIHARAVDLDVPTPVVDTLRDTLQSLNTPKTSRSSLRPVPIINALSTPVPGSQGRSKLFASREHQDAQELFQLLSECIKGEAQAVDAEAQRDRGLGAFTSASSPNSSSSSLFLKNSNGEVSPHYTGGGGEAELSSQSVFDGLTANRRSCVVCGYTEAVMHFAFATWSLALPSVGSGSGFGASSSSCTLQECLADYTRLELLTDCVCRRCSMRATHARLKEDAERLTEASSTKPGEAPKSQYKKKKAREARALERLVRMAIEEGRIEEDLSARGVKMERVVSPASTKQAMIARPPKVLVLHLNRSLHFSSFSSPARNPIRVRFPEILDLTPYTTSGQLSTTPSAPISTPPPPFPFSSFSSGTGTGIGIGIGNQRSTTPTQGMYEHPRVLYRLSAVVAHYGAHSFGHYVCFRRKPRFSKSRRRAGKGIGKGEEGRAYPSVPRMPCPYGCECQLCTAYGPVRDFDVDVGDGIGPSASFMSTTPSNSQPQVQNQKSYRPPPPGKGWLRVSDDAVEEVGLERVLSEGGGAFLLFYERVQNGVIFGVAGSVNASASGLFGRASDVLSSGASSSVESEFGSASGSGVGFGPGVGTGVNTNMGTGTGTGMYGVFSPSQPIGIAGGRGAGSVYQHLKERSTPRSSEETVRPVDVLSGTGSGTGSVSSSVSSTASSLSLPLSSSSNSKGKGKEKEKETGEDTLGSVSVSSSVSSSFGSSGSGWSSGGSLNGSASASGSLSGIGIVRPRIVRRTTAGRRERCREKGKEKKQRLETQPDGEPDRGVGATHSSANSGLTKQKVKEKAKLKERGTAEEDESIVSVSPPPLLSLKEKLGLNGNLRLPNGSSSSLSNGVTSRALRNDTSQKEREERQEVDLSESIVKVL